MILFRETDEVAYFLKVLAVRKKFVAYERTLLINRHVYREFVIMFEFMYVSQVWERCCFFGKLRRKRRKEQQSKWYLYFQPPLEGVNSHWFIPKYHKPFK